MILELSLPLLVPGVGANYANDTFAPNHFAVFAEFLNGSANFHLATYSFETIQPFDKSKGDISTITLSPGSIRTKFNRIFPERCAKIR
jgi:hypothetical protein